MQYIYYDKDTGQVEAYFNTPNLSVQVSWANKGLLRAVVPSDLLGDVNRDCKITAREVDVIGDVVIDGETVRRVVGTEIMVDSVTVSLNPIQPTVRPSTELDDLKTRVRDGVATLDDLLRIEQIKLGG